MARDYEYFNKYTGVDSAKYHEMNQSDKVQFYEIDRENNNDIIVMDLNDMKDKEIIVEDRKHKLETPVGMYGARNMAASTGTATKNISPKHNTSGNTGNIIVKEPLTEKSSSFENLTSKMQGVSLGQDIKMAGSNDSGSNENLNQNNNRNPTNSSPSTVNENASLQSLPHSVAVVTANQNSENLNPIREQATFQSLPNSVTPASDMAVKYNNHNTKIQNSQHQSAFFKSQNFTAT